LVKSNYFFARTLPIAHSVAILTAFAAYRNAIGKIFRPHINNDDRPTATLNTRSY
jgi:hypothetical protein